MQAYIYAYSAGRKFNAGENIYPHGAKRVSKHSMFNNSTSTHRRVTNLVEPQSYKPEIRTQTSNIWQVSPQIQEMT